MRRHTVLAVGLAALLLAGCGSGFTLGMGTVEIAGLAPGQTILCGSTGVQVQFAGRGFLSEHGVDVVIRWDAISGTPFDDGTAASTETMGTVLSDTLFEAELPDAFGTIPVLVTIILPGGNEGTSPPVTLEIGGEIGPPDAVDDAYGAIGNVTLVVPAGTGVLFNDEDGECIPTDEETEERKTGTTGPGTLTTGTVVDYEAITALGGTVVMQPDGSFEYNPPLGLGLPAFVQEPTQDSFTYTLEQDGEQDVATVTIDICETVWFITDGVPPGGTGHMADPFSSLAEFMAVQGGGASDQPEPGDWIFVYENQGEPYDGGIRLLDDQKLIGQGANLVVCGQTIVTATNRPMLTNQLGVSQALHCIELANRNRIDGLDVVAPAGNGIHGFGVDGPTTVDRCRVTGCGGDGVHLEGILNGPFDFSPDTQVDQCDGTAVLISSGEQMETETGTGQLQALTTGDFTFEGDISQVDTGPAISVFGAAAGTTITFQNGMIDYQGDDFAAIDLEEVSGTFTCTSPQSFLGTPFICIWVFESDGTFTFSDTTIDVFDDGLSSSGIEPLNVGGATLSFDDLDITIAGDDEAVAGGVGIRPGNLSSETAATTLNVTGVSSITMTDAEDACAILGNAAAPFTIDMTFTDISVDGSPQGAGMFFSNVNGSFDVTGTTALTNIASVGILFLDGDCDLTFPTLDISNVTGVAGRGIDIVDNAGTITISGGTWSNFTLDAVILENSNGAISNVAFSGVTVNVIELTGTCTVSGSGNTATTYGTLCDSAGAAVTGSISFTNPAVSCP